MNTLTVFPPNYHPVSIFVRDGKVVTYDMHVPPETIYWLHREGFIALMEGKITEDIVFESGLIDLALTESEPQP